MFKIKESLMEENAKEKKSDLFFTFFILVLALILLAFIILNNYVFGYVVVSGKSMESTLQTNDILIMNKLKGYKRGDVVVIEGEKSNGDWLIKRVIAIEGDTIDFKDGKVYLKKANESEFCLLEEPYLDDFQITKGYNDDYPVFIGKDEVFYLGDNRLNSRDSRSEFGTCYSSQIVGVISDKVIKNKSKIKKICSVLINIKKFFGVNKEVSD